MKLSDILRNKITVSLYEQSEGQPEGKPLKHLEHLEDVGISNGDEGMGRAGHYLENLHHLLMGKKKASFGSGKLDTSVSEKFDGAPAIIFGHHPQTGKFFVATKSAFNKNPKLNYTPEDVDANHGHAPGLAAKLKLALEHLPKIAPKAGVYQGDLMHDKDSVASRDGKLEFTPNTVTYGVDKDSAEGKRIKNSKLGIAVHTKYEGNDIGNMVATPNVDKSKFNDHPDVHVIDHTVKINPENYSPEDRSEFLNHYENARVAYSRMKPEALEAVQRHGIPFQTYVNSTVKDGSKPTAEGYRDWLTAKGSKEAEGFKTEAKREGVRRKYAAMIQDAHENSKHLDDAFKLHAHMQKAKDVLIRALNKSRPEYSYSVGGTPTKSEGYVAYSGGHDPVKLVDRNEFSRLNFAQGKMQAAKKKVKIDDSHEIIFFNDMLMEEAGKHAVISFVRMNPITKGHQAVVDKGMEVANKHGADYNLIVSHSQDPQKNPLSAEEKVKFASKAFPGAKVSSSSKEMPSMLHHASEAYKNGARHLHVVGGSDREAFEDLLQRYNGKEGKHGYYNFDSIHFHRAGAERAEGGKAAAKIGDVSTYSASEARRAAAEGRKEDFERMTPEGTKGMYDAVRRGMGIKD